MLKVILIFWWKMINDEKWVLLGADIKGDIYEGLLEKKVSFNPTLN